MRRSVIDFETFEIVSGAEKSPEPVGVAVYSPGRAPRYFSWGHPQGNNCTKKDARAVLAELCKTRRLVMHNAQFDLRVLQDHFNLKPSHGFDDTKLGFYLLDPRHSTLSLKPLSEELLGMPPEEQDELHDWLKLNYLPARRTKNPTKYTAQAPGDIAGRYAVGDVVRTWKLWRYVWPKLDARSREAYRRELAIIPLVIDMETRGVRLDVENLVFDISQVEDVQRAQYEAVCHKLGVQEINLASGVQLANAMEDAHLVDSWMVTAKGNRQVGIPALRKTCWDQEFVDYLEGYSKAGKLLGTYMRPWAMSGGRFHPYFNPIRTDSETGGTRTGRFSSNFQQIPKEPYEDLPWMRNYVLPDEGDVLVWRDYSQQELRLLAHYEMGDLCDAYNEDPDLDMHRYVGALMGMESDDDRKIVKVCNFLQIYGGGPSRLADQLDIPLDAAYLVKRMHSKAIPGVKYLSRQLENESKRKGYIRTWGGRKYAPEPGFEYKLLNLIIQGSAADQTKEAMIRYDGPGRFLMQVHDELVLTVPAEEAEDASEALRVAMEDIPGFNVPMRSDVKIQERWG